MTTAPINSAAPAEPSRRRWFGLLFISLAVALIIVDSTIVSVAMPSIVASLGLTSTDVQWVQESYTLVFAALLLPFGALADRFGRRRMLLVGLAIFGLSSFGIVFAPSGGAMIAARLVQGIGGAAILPATLSILNATFTGRERGIAFAVWGSTIGGMAAVGPLLGGWLTTAFSWHWAFGINVPLMLVIGAGILLTVVESKGPQRGRLDWGGALLSVLASAALVFGLIEGRVYGWWGVEKPFAIGDWTWPISLSVVPIAFGLSAVFLVAFIWRTIARERADRPTLLDFGLFRIPSFRNGNIVAALVSLGEFGLILSLPLWMQNVLGYNALSAGLTLVWLAVGSFLASGLVTPLSKRMSPVDMVRLGLVLEIAGVVGLGLVLTTSTPAWLIAVALGVYGLGVGFATAQLTGVVLVDVPLEKSGQASGTQSTARQVGSALGIAILGTVLFGATGAALQGSLDDRGLPPEAGKQIVAVVVDSAGTAIPGLEARDAEAYADAREAFTAGTRAAAFIAAGFLGVALLATASLGAGRAARRADAEGAAQAADSAGAASTGAVSGADGPKTP